MTVEWTTATETHTAGFYLYRADSADGSYVRVNEQIIPSSADPLNGGKYQYLDITADPSHTYYYKLEEVQDDGHTTLYGPIRVESDSGSGLYLWLIVGLSIVLISALFYVFRRHAP